MRNFNDAPLCAISILYPNNSRVRVKTLSSIIQPVIARPLTVNLSIILPFLENVKYNFGTYHLDATDLHIFTVILSHTN